MRFCAGLKSLYADDVPREYKKKHEKNSATAVAYFVQCFLFDAITCDF